MSFFDDEKQVVPLITCEDGIYSVDENTLEWLESVGEFGVISCAGKYRTGKSFLLNRLTESESNVGFNVGDSVQACTKGLWLYKKVFTYNDKNILFVDTEGIDALDANDTHDVRIFTLALLLSSSFIYNSVGPIDETALQTLSLMTKVTDNVKFDKNDENGQLQNLAPHMPKFYWVLRDFSLKLTNKHNEEISENEYLEQALQSTSDPNKNSVREAVRKSFDNRCLLTLPRPSANMDAQNRLEDKLMSLSKPFVNAVSQLRDKIFSENMPLKADTTFINGKMYAMLCRHYAQIVQSDAIPVIKDSWSLMADIHNRDVKDALVSECVQILSTMKPKTKDVIAVEMKALKSSLFDRFVTKSMSPVDDAVTDSFLKQMEEQCESARLRLEINVAESVDKSLESIESLIEDDPEKLSIILNRELTRFSDEHNQQQEFVKAWMVSASERALCRWIPRSLQSLSSSRDEALSEVKTLTDNQEAELNMIREKAEEAAKSERVKRLELEQLNESHQKMIDYEKDDNFRLRTEVICMSAELRQIEMIVPTRSVIEDESHSASKVEMQLQDELSNVQIENAELKAKLSGEKSNSSKHERLNKDLTERIEKAMHMHAQLEESWKQGIEELRKEHETAFDVQKRDYEAMLEQKKDDLAKLAYQHDTQVSMYNELNNDKKKLDEKFAQEIANNERQVSFLRETNQKLREQTEQSQNRVLEIHKNMIEDLRLRDERSREEKCKHMQEIANHQARVSDLMRETELQKNGSENMKRKLVSLETVELECKRVKTSEREKDILITQLRTEVSELRSLNGDMTQERESLRKENLTMSGELSLLRAEKKLADARRTIVS